MSASKVYLNGAIVDRTVPGIAPADRGFLYGDGFFETLRVFSGRPFLLDEHVERLNGSCRETGWEWRLDVDLAAGAVRALFDENGLGDAYVRITVSRGAGNPGLTELACREPTVLIDVRGMELPPLDELQRIKLVRSPYRRDEQSPLVRHKSVSYQLNVLALAEGRSRGADEVFFLNTADCLAEGAISNLFFVRDGVLFTPAVECGLLPGITRGVVIELAEREGIAVSSGCFPEDDLRAADEVFCTNSLRGVMSVRQVLDWPDVDLGEAALTSRLHEMYGRKVRNACGLG